MLEACQFHSKFGGIFLFPFAWFNISLDFRIDKHNTMHFAFWKSNLRSSVRQSRWVSVNIFGSKRLLAFNVHQLLLEVKPTSLPMVKQRGFTLTIPDSCQSRSMILVRWKSLCYTDNWNMQVMHRWCFGWYII